MTRPTSRAALAQEARAVLPGHQHAYRGLAELDEATLYRRREGVFLVLAGLFLASLAMLNILGISRFIKLGEATLGSGPDALTLTFAVAVGVLPYPITFLCTDFISELYGRARAGAVVWMGLVVNGWVVGVLWVGGLLPGFEAVDPASGELVRDAAGRLPVFFEIRSLAFAAVLASMIAYLVAQLVDVHVFHFWKRLTNGRHLWLRNNGSTLVSQLVDTVAVILITYFIARGLPVDEGKAIAPQLLLFVATGYAFKVAAALLDTVPFYVGSRWLARFLRLPPPGALAPPSPAAAVGAGVG
ncbi:MAG: queuosine precursor transporter [Phycisphaeraceae bacterium]|nr:queuosine precursor transporter [Phycisphaeraceae bacterium]